MSNPIAVEISKNALIIRFTRPEVRNPLSVDVLESLNRVTNEALASPGIGKLVFTGTGNPFASGADLREIDAITGAAAREFSFRGQRLMNKIADSGLHTVAAINGFCFGGALDLALACTERFASAAATFSHPGAGLGIITGWGGTQRLPRLIGQANALEMFFTASPIDAERALFIGLINRIESDPLDFAV